MTPLSRACVSSPCNCLYLVLFLRYSASKMAWPWNMGYRSFKVTGNGTIRNLGYGFLFSVSDSILYYFEIKRDFGRKSRFFHTLLHLTPQLGREGSPLEYCHTAWCGKTRMVWLPNRGLKRLRIRLTVSTEYRRVTDAQTDGERCCDGIVRAMYGIAR